MISKTKSRTATTDIATFCQVNFGVTFPLVQKSSVVKGPQQHPVYAWLTQPEKNGWNNRAPVWNFSKYLIDEHGVLTHYFDPGIFAVGQRNQNRCWKRKLFQTRMLQLGIPGKSCINKQYSWQKKCIASLKVFRRASVRYWPTPCAGFACWLCQDVATATVKKAGKNNARWRFAWSIALPLIPQLELGLSCKCRHGRKYGEGTVLLNGIYKKIMRRF